ncbi:MAG: hypothetical protein HC812_02790 [Leptolyngbya sp. RL_3_1]|nr:hypothetical protein [Leptolyngbya sp. RL_3_1]
MQSDLDALRITPPQLEQLTGLDIGQVFMGGVVRPSSLRSPQGLISFLITEGALLAVIFITCLGAGLVIARSWAGFNTNLAVLLGLVAGLTGAIAIAWHSYQWSRYKTLKPLARLLDEVDRHNDIVQAVQVMDELGTVPAATLGLPNRAEVITALKATRDSLVSALMTEKILRRHRNLIQRRQSLFSTIETNLATLQTLQVSNQATEYQQFLQEALEIGLAVQREIANP